MKSRSQNPRVSSLQDCELVTRTRFECGFSMPLHVIEKLDQVAGERTPTARGGEHEITVQFERPGLGDWVDHHALHHEHNVDSVSKKSEFWPRTRWSFVSGAFVLIVILELVRLLS